MPFRRYAIYYLPPKGALADFGAAWLGWDVETGKPVAHPDISGLPAPVSELTATPRKYGFHGTIRPPFRLPEGQSLDALEHATETLAAASAPLRFDGLTLSRLGRFLALTIPGDQTALCDLAGTVISALDPYRAPLTDAELARRRASRLSPHQDALLVRWGYPYVMDQFRFHITLTGRLARPQAEAVETALSPHIAPLLPHPFEITDLALVGEDEAGMFHRINRYALRG